MPKTFITFDNAMSAIKSPDPDAIGALELNSAVIVDEPALRWVETFDALDWVRDRLPGFYPLAVELRSSVLGLAASVAWEPTVLLERLGCNMHRLGGRERLFPIVLPRCASFLDVVRDTVALVPEPTARRRAVTMCVELFNQCNRDTTALRSALQTGECSAETYLELGEISRARRQAEMTLRFRPQLSEQDNPFAGLQAPHLSHSHITAYLAHDRDYLSDELLEKIESHIVDCEACQRAVESGRDRVRVGS